MRLGNIIGNMLSQGTSSQSQNRLRTGAENAERGGGGIEQLFPTANKQMFIDHARPAGQTSVRSSR